MARIKLIILGSLFLTLMSWTAGASSSSATSFIYLPMIAGGEDEIIPAGPFPPLTPEERMSAITTIEQTVNALVLYNAPFENRDFEREVTTLGEVLINLPHVYATVVSTETLTTDVIFTDGQVMQIINNRPAEQAITLAKVDALPDLSTPKTFGGEFPNGPKAILATFDGGEDKKILIQQKLVEKGYQVEEASASLNHMQTRYKDMAVLYLDTHGAAFSIYKINEQNGGLTRVRSTYGIQTSTSVTLETLKNNKAQFTNGEIALSIVPGKNTKVSITEKFIENHWSFDDGVAVFHTCFLGTDQFVQTNRTYYSNLAVLTGAPVTPVQGISFYEPKPVREAILGAGAQVMLTFDELTNTDRAYPSMEYFFDNLLGVKDDKPAPNKIPFPVSEVRRGMEDAGLMSYTVFFPNQQFEIRTVNIDLITKKDIRLAPSIENIEVKDTSEKGILEITGDFGEEQGKVTIEGTEVTITEWTPTKIKAETPTSGNGWIGEVFVLSKHDIKSNPVILREWRGTIDVTYDPQLGNLFAKTPLNVVFRGIVHEYQPDITSSELESVAPPTYLGAQSEAMVVATGEWDREQFTEVWSESSPLELEDPTVIDVFENTQLPIRSQESQASVQNLENIYGAKIFFRPADNRADLCLFIRGFYDVIWNYDDTNIDPVVQKRLMGTPFASPDGKVTTQESAEFLKGSLACYTTDLLPDYTIEAGLYFGEVEETEYAVQWSNLTTKTKP